MMEVGGRKPRPSVYLASEEDCEIYCNPCDRNGKIIEACGFCSVCQDYLCQTCIKQPEHKSHKPIDVNASLTIRKTRTSVRRKVLPFCASHPDEPLAYLCKTHDEIVCLKCVFTAHDNKACNVKTIQDLAQASNLTDRSKEVNEQVKSLEEQMADKKLVVSEIQQFSEKCYNEAVKEMQAFRKEINECLDAMERNILEEIDKIRQEYDIAVNKVAEKSESFEKQLQELRQTLPESTVNECEMFIEMKQVTEKLKQLEVQIRMVTQSNMLPLNQFKRSATFLDKLQSEKTFGNLVFGQSTMSKAVPVKTKILPRK